MYTFAIKYAYTKTQSNATEPNNMQNDAKRRNWAENNFFRKWLLVDLPNECKSQRDAREEWEKTS